MSLLSLETIFIVIGVDLGEAARTRAPIIERHLCFYQLLLPFPPIFGFPPKIFDKSTPVRIVQKERMSIVANI